MNDHQKTAAFRSIRTLSATFETSEQRILELALQHHWPRVSRLKETLVLASFEGVEKAIDGGPGVGRKRPAAPT